MKKNVLGSGLIALVIAILALTNVASADEIAPAKYGQTFERAMECIAPFLRDGNAPTMSQSIVGELKDFTVGESKGMSLDGSIAYSHLPDSERSAGSLVLVASSGAVSATGDAVVRKGNVILFDCTKQVSGIAFQEAMLNDSDQIVASIPTTRTQAVSMGTAMKTWSVQYTDVQQ